MMVGNGGFRFEDGLSFKFEPILVNQLYDQNWEESFEYLNTTKVTYINKTGKNTYGELGAKVEKLELELEEESMVKAPIVNHE